MPYRPRSTRDLHRIASAASAAGASGMDAALARIGAAFDDAAAINQFKMRIEQALRLGPQHPAVRARFRARAAAAPDGTLDDAIAAIERWWREEKKAFPLASALGYGNRLSLEVLRELRLILRLIRCKGMAGQFNALVAALCDDTITLAAAE
jgi:HPt (histidine-containing phosphotransfer) domain-containing protein